MEAEYPPRPSAEAASPSHSGSPSLPRDDGISNPPISRITSHESPTAVDHPKASPGGGTSDNLADLKRPRACEACRQLKVRCDPDPNNPDGTCKRCAKANRRCVVLAPTRKRQRKGDSRVAELEKKIDALTATLQASRSRTHPAGGNETQEGSERPWAASTNRWGSASGAAGNKRTFGGDMRPRPPSGPSGILVPRSRPTSPSGGPNVLLHTWLHGRSPGKPESSWPAFESESMSASRPAHEYADVIDRGVVDQESAAKAFKHYIEKMVPIMPCVVFPPGTRMGDVRRETPILFLAILSVSVGPFSPSLETLLLTEVHKIFADRVIVRGEKSLELVQALVIASMWYIPPEHYEELKFYLLIHLAAIMGMDLGMNRRSKPLPQSSEIMKELMSRKNFIIDPQSLDGRRAWLGCYVLAVNASMGLRRPLLTRWNAYMDESIQMLLDSPDAYPSDRALVEWVKLAHIGEDISFQFSMDDPLSNVAITDPKTQYTLKGFEGQLDQWRKEVPAEVYTPVMEHYEQVLSIYMHEIGMHIDHNIDDFKPPFLATLTEGSQVDLGTAAHVSALTACLTSTHRVLELFCNMDVDLIPCLPTIHFVRTSYACVALIKLFSVASAPASKLSAVFSTEDFKIEQSLNKLMSHLSPSQSRVGLRFTLIIGMLKAWYAKRKDRNAEVPLPPYFQPRGGSKAEKGDAARPPANKSPSVANLLSPPVASGGPSWRQSGSAHETNQSRDGKSSEGLATSPGQSNAPSTSTPHTAASVFSADSHVGTTNSASSRDWPQFISQNQINTNPYPPAHSGAPAVPQYMGSAFTQNQQGFVSQPAFSAAMDNQLPAWGSDMVPEADFSAMMALHPNLWDEELLKLSIEGFEGIF